MIAQLISIGVVKDRWLLNYDHKYCRKLLQELFAMLLTCIKLAAVVKAVHMGFLVDIIEGFTVAVKQHNDVQGPR